jgi:hypothetical protein
MYQQYLILLAELKRGSKGALFSGKELFEISTPREGVWIISTTVVSFDAKIPSKIAECLFSCSLQSFQTRGPQLQKEGKKIVLKHALRAPDGFSSFKQLIHQLAFQAQEWRETLHDLSRQSPSKISNQALFFAY